MVRKLHCPAAMTSAKTIVLGAGPTGLSAAFHLGKDTLLVERENSVGGCCRSIYLDGFTFDLAGHILDSTDPYVQELYTLLLRDNVHWQDREAWVYSKGAHTRYPFEGALHGLPVSVVQECLVGAVEAHQPSRKAAHSTNVLLEAEALLGSRALTRNGNGTHRHNGNGNGTNGHDSDAANGFDTTTEPANFEDWIHRTWGAGIARHFAIPYYQKLWTVPLAEMETSWLRDSTPALDLEAMIEGALAPVPKPTGPNAAFGYPMRGGFQALMDAFLPYIKGHLRLNTTAVALSPSQHEVRFHDGSTASYESLISTIPLPRLVALLGTEAPDHVRDAAAGLRHVSVRSIHIGVGRERITDKHWIYYPEDPMFHRIFVQGNASPQCNPPGGFGLTCEVAYSATKPLPAEGQDLIQRCVDDCRRVGIMRDDDSVRIACQADLPFAYVVSDHSRRERVETIRDWLRGQDILLAGCVGEWECYESDRALLAGRNAAVAAQPRAASDPERAGQLEASAGS